MVPPSVLFHFFNYFLRSWPYAIRCSNGMKAKNRRLRIETSTVFAGKAISAVRIARLGDLSQDLGNFEGDGDFLGTYFSKNPIAISWEL